MSTGLGLRCNEKFERVVLVERPFVLEHRKPTTPAGPVRVCSSQKIQPKNPAALVRTHARAVWRRNAGCDNADNDAEQHASVSACQGAHIRAAAAASSPA